TGAQQAATPQQPGETEADALQRRLLGGAGAVGGAAMAAEPVTAAVKTVLAPKPKIAPETSLNATIQPHAPKPTAQLAQDVHPVLNDVAQRTGVDIANEPKPVAKLAELTKQSLNEHNQAFD